MGKKKKQRTEFQKWRSIMAKVDNELAKKRLEESKVKKKNKDATE